MKVQDFFEWFPLFRPAGAGEVPIIPDQFTCRHVTTFWASRPAGRDVSATGLS